MGSDEEENELDDLEAGANMPLDELLKLYGQNASAVNKISHENDEVKEDLIKSFFFNL